MGFSQGAMPFNLLSYHKVLKQEKLPKIYTVRTWTEISLTSTHAYLSNVRQFWSLRLEGMWYRQSAR
jgi:hypothetical protein